MVTAGVDGNIRIYEAKTYSLREQIQGHEGGVTCLKFLDHERMNTLFVTGALDGTCKLWDAKSGTCLQTFQGHAEAILSLDVRTDGSRITIMTASDDHTAKLWAYDV